MEIIKLCITFWFIFLTCTINYSDAYFSMKDYRALVKDFMKSWKSPSKFVDWYILDLIPFLLGEEPTLANGTFSQYKELAETDHSNDEIKDATVLEMIKRAGFQYVDHHVTSEDGYINQLINLVNPLADKTKLKKPPVILFHGGLVDPSIYVWSSNIQHHPEKWPRDVHDGPMTSSNRSIAFVLANNGYDVWLVGSRGSNQENQHKNRKLALKSWYSHFKNGTATSIRHETTNEQLAKLFRILTFYDYDLDDLSIDEMPLQLELVMKVTGTKELSILTYSFSTMTSLTLLSRRPDIAKVIRNLIMVAPIINTQYNSLATKAMCYFYRLKIPEFIGEFYNRRILFSELTRAIVGRLSNPKFKYTIIKLISDAYSGASGKYRTFLEPAVVSHQFMPSTYRQMRHYCQQTKDHRLQKFDYGYARNLLIYGKLKPPAHNITTIKLNNWMIITGSLDNLAPPYSSEQILRELSSKPNESLYIIGYNHLDIFAAFDNDILVNKPIVSFLDKNSYQFQNQSH